jgi:hypothetical protein
VLQLKAKGQREGDDQFHKGLAVAKQVKVRCFILEIDGDGPVFSGRCGRSAHVSPPGYQVS